VLAIGELHNELGAIAVVERRIGVKGQTDVFSVGVGGAKIKRDILDDATADGLSHTFDDVDEASAAAIDDASFLQDRQKFRSLFERLFHLLNESREIIGK